MKSLQKFKELNQDEILLYSLLIIVNLTTIVFLIIYFLWVPFWPARIVHIIYLLFNLYLVCIVKKKGYLFVKVSILISNLVQLFLATFFWFPLSTHYELFYFLLPMGSFAILNVLNSKERNIALGATFISFLLFFMNTFIKINYYIFELSDIAVKMISFLTVTSTMGILTLYFYLHAFFLAQKRTELEYLANTDSLTNISNRRNFYKLSNLEFQLAQKYNHTFSVMLLDIDYFKRVNDTYGHDVGDIALKYISNTIKETIRHNDIFARHGGEEFTLLLRYTDAKTSIKIAEKIRKTIENLDIPTKSGIINITISIGVVEFSKDYTQFDKLIILADKALYEAKEKGRNCVVYKS